MEIKTARRKSFDVEFVVVSEDNIEDVASWCGGAVVGEGSERYIKINDKNAMNARQTKAFIEDLVLKHKKSFKVYGQKAFDNSFEEYTEKFSWDEEREVHRSAVDGQFVTKEDAEANPETTVTETIEAPVKSTPQTRHGEPYWEYDEKPRKTLYYNGDGLPISKEEYDRLVAVSEIPVENLRMTDD